VNAPELALHHQRLAARAALLRGQIERRQAELSSDQETDRLDRALQAAAAARQDLELRLRDRDREVESHRGRLRTRERELMSGRIKNPTELVKLDEEVRHLKTALRFEEDAELDLMEEQERLEREVGRLGQALEAARARVAETSPALRERIAREEAELAAASSEVASTWEQLPANWRTAYGRVADRVASPIAEVVGNQCQACHVTVTTSGMQVLRRAGLLQCDNCGRILVVA
jgi:predicted  nucleic acid-binding Zn-ribbon protein